MKYIILFAIALWGLSPNAPNTFTASNALAAGTSTFAVLNSTTAPIDEAEVTEESEHEEKGVAGKLGLDLKLFIAQLLNFSIILVILWRWVFRPIASRLEARTRLIEQSLKDAEDIELQKKDFDLWKEVEIKDARTAALMLTQSAKTHADNIIKEAKAQALKEQDKIVASGREQLKMEREEVMSKLKGEIADMIGVGVEKVLGQKLDSAADKKLIRSAAADVHKKL